MKTEIVPIIVPVRFLGVDKSRKEQTEKDDMYFVYYKPKLLNRKQVKKNDGYIRRNAIIYKNICCFPIKNNRIV